MLFYKLYNIVVSLFGLIIKLFALAGHGKALSLSEAHNQARKELITNINESYNYWFHCSSLGEFEQARSIIEALHLKGNTILLSFFSPSGYKIRKDYKMVSKVIYLPLDTKRNAALFIKKYSIGKVIWVKYDFWLNILKEINKNDLPIYLIAFIQNKNTNSFKRLIINKALNQFNIVFAQDEKSLTYLKKNKCTCKSILSGDPRVDRVYQVKNEHKEFDKIKKFKGNDYLIIAGSTYEKENKMLQSFLKTRKDIKLIIAPPDINKKNISSCLNLFESSCLYSTNDFFNKRVLIVDNIGMLSHLYRYADLAVIGGGFTKGIHNILEAAVFGVPSFFGPNYNKFIEAIDLIKKEGAFSFIDYIQLKNKLNNLLDNIELRNRCRRINTNYINSNLGETEKIVTIIQTEGGDFI